MNWENANVCLDNSFNLREWVLHIQNGSISCSNLDKFIKISISMSERERKSECVCVREKKRLTEAYIIIYIFSPLFY